MQFSSPLENIRLTQPFGVNWTGEPDFYSKYGLDGHNGWDFGCNQALVYAVADGWVAPFQESTRKGYGIGIWHTVPLSDTERLGVVYGHLQKTLRQGSVSKGDVIAISDNTGDSTGPHLHFGVYKEVAGPNETWQRTDMKNGFLGWKDPTPYFPEGFLTIPVDKKYDLKKRWMSELEWLKCSVWFYKTFRRLMTTREANAFIYGCWDVRTVLNDAMFTTWAYFTKPEAKLKKLI